MRILVCAGAALVVSLASSPVSAQSRATTADLTGTVRDPSGAVVPGARITATDAATNLERATTSKPDGRFDILAVPPGRYELRVSFAGFATQVLEGLDLPLGSALDLDIGLTIARPNEQIVVAPEPPALDTQRTAIATVVAQPQLERLPLNGRNFVSLSLITPAVTVDRVPQQGAAAGSGLTFVGQRARSNNITVDGLDNNDTTLGSVAATFSQDAVREFQVVAHSYTAEFGKATGGVVNIVTKSGTNRPAGGVFFFFRDEALNAREYFERFAPDGTAIAVEKAPFSQKQFGGTLGGPLRRDRTFYFAAFERLALEANNFVTIDDTSQIAVAGQPAGTLLEILARAGFPAGTGYVPYGVRSNAFLGRVDHRFRADRTLTLRYNGGSNHNGNVDAFGGTIARSRGGALDSADHAAAASATTVHGSVVNEVRLQVARRDQQVLPLDPTCNGVCDRDDEGGPTVELSGVASAGRNRIYPQLRDNIRYQAIDTITRIGGAHELKAGFDFSWLQGLTTTLPLHYGGRFIFAPLPAIPGLLPSPVTAAQAFALGLPAAYVQGYGDPNSGLDSGDLSLFVQDSWRLRPDLTVKAGLRYQTQFWTGTPFNVPGLGSYDFPADRNDIAPRLAASWNPGQDRATTVHAAYGLFFDRQISGVANIADIVDGTPGGTRTLLLRFPQSLAAWRAPGRRIPEPATAYPSLVISLDPDMRTPYAHHGSFGVERLLPGDLTISASGVWVRGFNQLGSIDYNPIVTSLGAGRRPLDVGGVPGTSASVLQYTSYGETWYRALLLTLNKRFDGRFQLLTSYTLSSAEDMASDFQSSVLPQFSGLGRDPGAPRGLPVGFDPLEEKGPALHDQRHRLVVSGTYVTPGRISVSAILTAASGWPYSVLAGADLNGDGDGGAFPPDRARRVPSDASTSLPRNSGRLPVQSTVDLRVSRSVGLTGTGEIEFLVEVFNLFNRANFTEVNNIFGAGAFPDNPLPTYGQFQRSGPPRQIQLGARLRF
jgi:outer membrane receptor protein involved in Fe transport